MDRHLLQLPPFVTNVLVILTVSLLTASCNEGRSRRDSEGGKERSFLDMPLNDFRDHPEAYDGKYVRIAGMCIGIDKRGGGAMSIIGKDHDFEITVMAGEDVIRFSRYFEGRNLEVYGYVRNSDPVFTATRNRESGKGNKRIYPYSKPHYHIECDRYRRIPRESP